MFALAAAWLVLTAQPTNRWVDEAKELISKLQFADAIERLTIARKVRGLERDEEKRVLELLAYCQVAEGQRENAESTFISLLELDAAVELSSTVSSPKVVEAFDAARKRHFPSDYVRLEERASPAGRAAFVLVDPWKQVTSVVVVQRRDGQGWTEANVDGTRGEFAFPLVVNAGSQLEWYVEARAADARVTASIASSANPKLVKAELVSQQAQTLVATPPVPHTSTRRVVGIVLMSVGLAAAGLATGFEVSGNAQRVSARDRSRPPGNNAATALRAESDGTRLQTVGIGLFIGAGVAAGVGLVFAL